MIMAGGAGTRLWPLSRQARPKQLLPFIRREGDESPKSLLQLAADRLEGLVPPQQRYICTGESYRAAIEAALPAFAGDQILGEPAARDTVNAVGFAAAVFETLHPGAVFCVLTADHVIEPADQFRHLMDLGFRLVEDDPTRLVTFAIKPTHPATGFGYVERAKRLPGYDGLASRVARFVEKPDEARAQAYVESGHFGWNSGMFVFSARTFMNCLDRFKPESAKGLRRIQQAWTTKQREEVLGAVYPTLPKISVDYAVMEPASRDEHVSVVTVEMDLTWLDVGSWPSYAETVPADASNNRVVTHGRAIAVDSRDNLIVDGEPDGHTLALLGCEGLVVVRTKDATLIMPKAKAEALKLLHAQLPPELT